MPHHSQPHYPTGGRHELGQNFLTHRPTIDRVVALATADPGPILEIGAGDGALTAPLARTGRDVVAIDVDEHRVARLARRLPAVRVVHADALHHPLDRPVVVGNVPFHLTTPILRRLLSTGSWRRAVLLTQWEVARKRAGVGGSTMMTAQAAPWFSFELHGRVPARHFAPAPSVDGGLLTIERRGTPLVAPARRRDYEQLVRAVFTGRGRGVADVAARSAGRPTRPVRTALVHAGVDPSALPRDLSPTDWAALWEVVSGSG